MNGMPKMLQILGQVNVDGDFFTALPSWAKLIFIVLAAAAIIMLIAKYGSEAYERLRGMRRRNRVNTDILNNHSFFSKCDSWSKYKINELYFGDEVRNRLFRTIVGAKIEVMAAHAKDLVNSDGIGGLSKQCFRTKVFKTITEIHTSTQDEIILRLRSMYPDHYNEIYELVINHKVKGFNAFNQITDNYTERLVHIICESDMYDDNYEKLEMILDAFKSSLGAVFPHIESAFNGFNGELDHAIKGD
jgi:hypothetical protein